MCTADECVGLAGRGCEQIRREVARTFSSVLFAERGDLKRAATLKRDGGFVRAGYEAALDEDEESGIANFATAQDAHA